MSSLFPRLGGCLRRVFFRTEPRRPLLVTPSAFSQLTGPSLSVSHPTSVLCPHVFLSEPVSAFTLSTFVHIKLQWTQSQSPNSFTATKISHMRPCPLLQSPFRASQFVLTSTASNIKSYSCAHIECVSYLCNNSSSVVFLCNSNSERGRRSSAMTSCSCTLEI